MSDSTSEVQSDASSTSILEALDPNADVQMWPANVEMTEQALQEVQQLYDLIHVESLFGIPVLDEEDAKDWNGIVRDGQSTRDIDQEIGLARFIAKKNPFVKRALVLYDIYVFGSDFSMTLTKIHDDPEKVTDEERRKNKAISRKVTRLWNRVLKKNRNGWSISEFGRRVWRDGEQFTRIFDQEWPVTLRFIDPETIRDQEGGDGIDTAADDVATPTQYHIWDSVNGKEKASIDASEVFHTKIECDSTEKRGTSRFASVVRYSKNLSDMVSNEVSHRQAQNSIILVRRVAGGRRTVQGLVDNAQTTTTDYPEGTVNREKLRPGTILTSTKNIDYEFVTPNSNYKDASPLVKLLIMHISAATGFTYGMISSDASESNNASANVSESPVLQMVKRERKEFSDELIPIFERTIETAIRKGKLDELDIETVWDEYEVTCTWGQLVTRDRLKDVQADNILIMNGSISPQEGARRAEVDPEVMMSEIKKHREEVPTAITGMNPGQDSKQASSAANAQAGGTNATNDPVSHDDKVT